MNWNEIESNDDQCWSMNNKYDRQCPHQSPLDVYLLVISFNINTFYSRFNFLASISFVYNSMLVICGSVGDVGVGSRQSVQLIFQSHVHTYGVFALSIRLYLHFSMSHDLQQQHELLISLPHVVYTQFTFKQFIHSRWGIQYNPTIVASHQFVTGYRSFRNRSFVISFSWSKIEDDFWGIALMSSVVIGVNQPIAEQKCKKESNFVWNRNHGTFDTIDDDLLMKHKWPTSRSKFYIFQTNVAYLWVCGTRYTVHMNVCVCCVFNLAKSTGATSYTRLALAKQMWRSCACVCENRLKSNRILAFGIIYYSTALMNLLTHTWIWIFDTRRTYVLMHFK